MSLPPSLPRPLSFWPGRTRLLKIVLAVRHADGVRVTEDLLPGWQGETYLPVSACELASALQLLRPACELDRFGHRLERLPL